MIEGRVNAKYEATVPLTFYAGDGAERTFTAVIDTGCDMGLVVSQAEAILLNLTYVDYGYMKLADAEYITIGIYEGDIDWHGTRTSVEIACIGDGVLVGMGLLRDHQMNIDIRPGGLVQII